ncbi:MAG: hypothetical protein ACREXX_03720, partial [Gammaproteobacteria bacterium]
MAGLRADQAFLPINPAGCHTPRRGWLRLAFFNYWRCIMGWLFTAHQSKAELVRERTVPWQTEEARGTTLA